MLRDKYNRQLYTYVLPPDLLEPPTGQKHHVLKPYSIVSFPEPAYAVAVHPSFSLAAPEQCLYLSSIRDMPIRLLSPFASGILASYPLVNEQTERWMTPNSLLFHPRDLNTFFAGGIGTVSLFDINRNGEPPYRQITRPLIKSVTRQMKVLASMAQHIEENGHDSWHLKGIVSAMDMNCDGLLAAGTFSKRLAILDPTSSVDAVGRLPLPQDEGTGVTGVKFHPSPSRCNYLVVGSRRSTMLHVFDIRNLGSVMATLTDRISATPQRLEFDVTGDGKVWAGCTDGKLRVWDELGLKVGDVSPSWEQESHRDTVAAVQMHPGGAPVMATCGGASSTWLADREKSVPGQRRNLDAEESDQNESERTISYETDTHRTLEVWQVSLDQAPY